MELQRQPNREALRQQIRMALAGCAMPEFVEYDQPDDGLLPVERCSDEIEEAVRDHQAVVFSAETGGGKSTKIPQILAKMGYSVLLTQPRRLAARSVASRIGDETRDRHGRRYVGYKTAREDRSHPDNMILTCTDGLAAELMKTPDGKRRVLVIDEIHEWNTNIEVLLALAKQRMQIDPDFKLICMSATVEGQKVAEYLGAGTPLIEIPGRTYPVEKREGQDLVEEVLAMAKQGKNTLVFLPGKQQIRDVQKALEAAGITIPILPLHGELDKTEQDRAFASYEGGKIVLATNVAQTSITIEDIDAVVDSGQERRKETRGGVDRTFVAPISQADCLQRAGRAGRCREGVYVLAPLKGERAVPFAERPEHPTPEILRTSLDNTVLKLAAMELEIEELEFFHQPPLQEIRMAKQRLLTLGALDTEGKITEIGKKMERLPLDAHLARMVVEAQTEYSQLVLQHVLDVVAIQQAGGVVRGGKNGGAWRELTTEQESDVLAQLDIMVQAGDMTIDEKKERGIINRQVREAREIKRDICKSLRIEPEPPEQLDDWEREPVMKCIAAGLIDRVWQQAQNGYRGAYISVNGQEMRVLDKNSVIQGEPVIVAMPMDIGTPGRRVGLLQSATRIEPEWYHEQTAKNAAYSDAHRRARRITDQAARTAIASALSGEAARTLSAPSPATDPRQILVAALTRHSARGKA